MKKIYFYKSILLAFIFLFIQNSLISCTCWPYEPVFCRAVNESLNIVRAVVIEHPESYLMEVKIIENLHEEISSDSILIYGQDGFTCGENLNQFNISDTLILAIKFSQIYENQFYWYLEGFCGIHFLRYANGIVNGQIRDSLTSQPIETFKEQLLECLEMTVPIEEIFEEKKIVDIYPNPVLNELKISIVNSMILSVEIYTIDGRLNQNMQQLNSNSVIIDSHNLESGIYIVKIETTTGNHISKFIKS